MARFPSTDCCIRAWTSGDAIEENFGLTVLVVRVRQYSVSYSAAQW